MTSLLTVKLRRDMRATWSRLGLMAVAIAVSLSVFGGVLYAWTVASRETVTAYLDTEPASATILLDAAIPAREMAVIADEAAGRPGVLAATGRTQFDADVEVNGRPRVIPLQVFVATADDPLAIARFEVEAGAWPPAPDEILLGRDSLDLLDVAAGDLLTLGAPGGEIDLRVAGTVYDPSLSPAAQEQRGHAYLSADALAASGGEATLDQLKLQIADTGQAEPSSDRDAVVDVASNVGSWLQETYGLAIREIQVPEPYAHPHQWQADALLGALLAGGAAALILSSILVANMLNSIFTQQIPQIGIMKAIGARSGHIGRLYLAMTLLVAGLATLLALVPSIVIGRLLLGQIFGFLGIQPASLLPPWWTFALIVLVGLALPPLMALRPLVRASRITVRAAIDHHGGGGASTPVTRVLARLGLVRRMDRGLLLALRNTVRRPARFLLAVGLLASAGAVFVAGVSLSGGVAAIEEEQSERRTWDVDASLGRPATLDEVRDALQGVAGIGRVEGLNLAMTGIAGPGAIPVTRTYPDQGHGRVSLTAIPADTTSVSPGMLLEGRWLEPGEIGSVVLNQTARNNTVPDVRPGDAVQLSVGGVATTWRVVGIVQERGGGSAVYTTAEAFADALDRPQQVNELRIVTAAHDEGARRAAAEAVDEALTDAGVDVRSADSISRSEAVSEGHLGPIVTIVLAIAIAMGVVGAIGLGSTMSANILDRTREFGIMHAIGARPRAVRRIVIAEGVFMGLASFGVAILPALGLIALLGAGLGNLFFAAPLPYRVSLLAVGIWLVLVVLGAILATDAAATRASRITVREALAYL